MTDKTGIDDEGRSLAYHKQHHTDYYQATLGLRIADMLSLTQDRDGRYATAWGTKTPLGLYFTIQRIIADDYESTRNCGDCRKCGETICGNDLTGQNRCFESK